MTQVPRARLYAVLLLAVVVISFAGVIIKLIDAPALVIAAWRLCMATLILAPWTLRRVGPQLRALGPLWPWVIVSGAALALHFGSWILSLQYTSVASSVVLVTTSPLFVGLGSHFLLKERVSRPLAAGIGLSVGGGILIGYGDFQVGGLALWGDVLALIGALTVTVYFLIGRRIRDRISLWPYLFLVYGTAGGLLLASAFAWGQPLLGYSLTTYGLILLLAVGPQLVGHSGLNFSLRHLSAGAVSISTLGEPVLAAAWAYLVLGETPTPFTFVGGALILAGVYVALRAE